MESLGDKLRGAREGKGLSFEYVGRETMIARRYLEALEREDFAKFPGEPYLLGFLRNYGDYLGLDVDELLSLYRSIKIQEQPIPVEQLLRAPSSSIKPLTIVVITLLVLGLLAGGAWFVYYRPRMRQEAPAPVHIPTEYNLDEEADPSQMERRFYRGDTILIPLGRDTYKVELREMGDPLALWTPQGDVALSLGGDREIDLNGDGDSDMMITLEDYDKSSPTAGALIRFTRIEQFTAPSAIEGAEPGAEAARAVFPTSTATSYPFTLQVSFQGPCMFRWEFDRRERTERYFSRSEEPLSIQAQNYVRLWVSNAAAVRLQVSGAGKTVPLEIGAAGEVVVVDIRWRIGPDGRYQLIQYSPE